MSQDRSQGILDTVDAHRLRQRAAIERWSDELRTLIGTPAYRVWYCPFSSQELIELGDSGLSPTGHARSLVVYASSQEQLREAPLSSLCLFHYSVDGTHPRWDNLIRDLYRPARASAAFWEVDLCLEDDSGSPRRVGVITLFDPSGHAPVPEELSEATRTKTDELLQNLAQGVESYRRACYDSEIIGALEQKFIGKLIDTQSPLNAASFFDSIALWFRRIIRTNIPRGLDDAQSIRPNVCALFIKQENRLVLVDATSDYKMAATLASDGVFDNPLTRIPLDQNDSSLIAFAYDVMTREHQPLIFPSGRSDGAYLASLLEDLRHRISHIDSRDSDDLSAADESGEYEPHRSAGRARELLREFYQQIKHQGSCGFFPLMRREEVEGVFVLLSAYRTFFNPANVLLVRAVADRLGRLPDLLPDHRQDKDYRDRKTGLIYIEQRHQRVDRYLTGGQHVRGLAVLDIDDFRGLNDLYGHRVGDKILEAVMESLAVVAYRPTMLENHYSSLQFIEQEKTKIDAEQYATTELSKMRRHKKLALLPLHYGGDEFGLVLLGRDDGDDAGLVDQCERIIERLSAYLRFRLAGLVDSGRLRVRAVLTLPDHLGPSDQGNRNEFSLYTMLRDQGNTLMYFAKDVEGIDLYCPGHSILQHRFELELDEGGPGIWRAILISRYGAGDRMPMSGDTLELDLLHALDRTVGRHIRDEEQRESTIRRIKKSMTPIRFEVLARLSAVGTRGGRGIRDQYLVRQIDPGPHATVRPGDHLLGHICV